MSFDLFFGCFEDGESASVSISIVKDALGDHIAEIAENHFVLQFGNELGDHCDLYIETGAEQISSFSVNRPRDDPRLFNALLQILKTRGLVLYMPGDCPPLIGNPETAVHLPLDMVDGLGQPVLLTAGSEIVNWIQHA